jgi:hypothetical protein
LATFDTFASRSSISRLTDKMCSNRLRSTIESFARWRSKWKSLRADKF